MEPSHRQSGPTARPTLPGTQPGPLCGMGGEGPLTNMMRPSSYSIFASKQIVPPCVGDGKLESTEEVL